jgi:hypothetical protein
MIIKDLRKKKIVFLNIWKSGAGENEWIDLVKTMKFSLIVPVNRWVVDLTLIFLNHLMQAKHKQSKLWWVTERTFERKRKSERERERERENGFFFLWALRNL